MTSVPVNSSRKSHKATILVIEDNADQWFMIHRALLERFPEVDPIWMQEPVQAIMYLDACKDPKDLPRLILLDLYLPHRTQGWNLLTTLKSHHLYREVPVVVLSQSTDAGDISESYNLRVNSYIVKPGNYEKWLDCISLFRQYWWDAVTLPKYK